MFLNRCSTRLNKVNVSSSFLRLHPIVHFSSDKKPKDSNEKMKKTEEKSHEKEKDAPQALQKERIRNLLSKLSKNSTLQIIREVQTAKPLGYKKISENQKQGKYYPKKPNGAVRAVAKEVGDEKVINDLLDSIDSKNADKHSENLDVVVAMMHTSKKVTNKKTFEINSSSNFKDVNSTIKARTQSVGRSQGLTREPLKMFSENTKPESRVASSTNEVSVFGRAEDVNSTIRARTQHMGRFKGQSREPLKIFSENAKPESRVASSTNEVSVFGSAPLNILEVEKLVEHQSYSKSWNKAEKHEFRLKTAFAPRNYFEKMAYWTEEGKIWKFPIDNEQGLDTEHQTPFTDHIFLEDLIESWCPKKGAVRNFMELICIGLSKNPYLSVQEKRDHIEWYRNYFHDKSHILQKAIEHEELQLKQAAMKLID